MFHLLFILGFFLVMASGYDGHISREHLEARKNICCSCGEKKKCRPVIDSIEHLVKQHCYEGYSTTILAFPVGVCGSCTTNLFLAKKGLPVSNFIKAKWKQTNWDLLTAPQGSNPCHCPICVAAAFCGTNLTPHISPHLPRKTDEVQHGQPKVED